MLELISAIGFENVETFIAASVCAVVISAVFVLNGRACQMPG